MELLQAGVDRAVIALWLGHESVETTQIYLDANLAIKAVSYTHLDVYKRQRTNFRRRWALGPPPCQVGSGLRRWRPRVRKHLKPLRENAYMSRSVSYTHLDVYKRQRHDFGQSASILSATCCDVFSPFIHSTIPVQKVPDPTDLGLTSEPSKRKTSAS